ncbi:MAG: hypothetical protein M1820_002837 [Bogoriella megaspora]|nr:MAG: hypothetical protein M1820_002837 [Bogoriella megaspora]
MSGRFNPFASNFDPYYTAPKFNPQQDAFQQGLPPFTSPTVEDIGNFPLDNSFNPAIPGQSSSRDRRKSQTAPEQVKHRRTRSGCYTCRNRRVKCDEKHPICERCRKGNRECVYPSKAKTSKSSRSLGKSKNTNQDSDSPSEAYESEDKDHLNPIPDDEEESEPPSASSTKTPQQGVGEGSQREPSDPPSLTFEKSTSPSTEGSISQHHESKRLGKGTLGARLRSKQSVDRISNVKSDNLEFYLDYYRSHITCHHYGWKIDGTDFLHTEYLEIARSYKPLLYAVAGFAAYHYTISNPSGKLQDFLQLYSTSVSLLRMSLKDDDKHTEQHTEPALFTILQLATFEEYMGDWLNLISHQKAALTLITGLYTPDTIMGTPTLRRIFIWYTRFDITVGFLSGNGVILDRKWMAKCHESALSRVQNNPSSIRYKIEEYMTHHRLLAVDLAILFAKRTKAKKGLISQSEQEFWSECNAISERIQKFSNNWDPALRDPTKVATDFSGWKPRPVDDIVDPTEQRPFYTGDLQPMNLAIVDLSAMNVMFKYKLAQLEHRPPPPECRDEAFNAARMFEAIELCPDSQPGALLAASQSFAMACLFLPKDERHTTWLRRKFATMESNGYIFPSSLRRRMSQHWGVDVTDWWLPNNEGHPPILRLIREFLKDRMNAMNAPKDQFSQDVRDINGIFSTLNIDDPDQVGDATSPEREDSSARQALAAMDLANMAKMSGMNLDIDMGSDDSPPQFLQEMAKSQFGW